MNKTANQKRGKEVRHKKSGKKERPALSQTSGCVLKQTTGRNYPELGSEQVFPCRSNAGVRAALMSRLLHPQVHVEVVGGIVRHQLW